MNTPALVAAIVAITATGAFSERAPYHSVADDIGLSGEATGFFHMETIGGVDWVIDTVGRAMTICGINHVRPAAPFGAQIMHQ